MQLKKRAEQPPEHPTITFTVVSNAMRVRVDWKKGEDLTAAADGLRMLQTGAFRELISRAVLDGGQRNGDVEGATSIKGYLEGASEKGAAVTDAPCVHPRDVYRNLVRLSS